MSLTLRVFLIVASVISVIYTLRKIRKAQLNIDDSIYWIVMSILLLVMSIFPNAVSWAAKLFGFVGVVNFVFFFMIFAVIIKLFQISIDLSISKHRLNLLIQKTALLNKEMEFKINMEPLASAAEDEAPKDEEAISKSAQNEEEHNTTSV